MHVVEVAKTRKIEPARAAVIERVRLTDHVVDDAGNAGTHQVLAEVVADMPARVADAVGILRRLGKQHQPRGFECRRAQDNRFRFRMIGLAGVGIDEGDAARLARVLIHGDLIDRGIGAKGQVARVHGRVDESGG